MKSADRSFTRIPGSGSGNPPEHRTLKLRVIYCGGCNPEIDRGRVVERLYDLMRAEGLAFCPVPDCQSADVVLIVNGCGHACREEEPATASFPFISVQGKRLLHDEVSEDLLPEVLLKQLLNLA